MKKGEQGEHHMSPGMEALLQAQERAIRFLALLERDRFERERQLELIKRSPSVALGIDYVRLEQALRQLEEK